MDPFVLSRNAFNMYCSRYVQHGQNNSSNQSSLNISCLERTTAHRNQEHRKAIDRLNQRYEYFLQTLDRLKMSVECTAQNYNVNSSNRQHMNTLTLSSNASAVQSQPSAVGGENKSPLKQTLLLSALQQFEHIPIECVCSSCQQHIITRTVKKNGALNWLTCGGTFMIGCVAGCCLIPFCIDGLKNTMHYCPNCGKLLAEVKRI
ncbi:unnamed protein product [Adineta ricciae]|uniref:LITAF domain-containing protein n=1 Tax=Adineta ricciae TaxID=249248 RepID=A0A815CBM8_ADIRI|nr:unnamed protein product [Adineta ricciae]CAF1285056.1 unnamed protein product [Adineta ricciae]